MILIHIFVATDFFIIIIVNMMIPMLVAIHLVPLFIFITLATAILISIALHIITTIIIITNIKHIILN